MNVKELLRSRFAPIPADVPDPELRGLLFVRRLRVPELQLYLRSIGKKDEDPDAEDKQALLLKLAVCDEAGAPVFADAAEAADLLGDCWLPLYSQVAELMFPGATAEADPTPASGPKPTPSSG